MQQYKARPHVVAGIITYTTRNGKYDTAKYLPYFLASYGRQTFMPQNLLALDASVEADNCNIRLLQLAEFPVHLYHPGENLGFAKSYNVLIEEARRLHADYFLVSNVDMFYEPQAVASLVDTLESHPRAGCATGKIFHWNFARADEASQGKTDILDSAGMSLTVSHHFFERGQGNRDQGFFDRPEEIFGAGGTLALFRMDALQKVAYTEPRETREYYDALMFMYKEDADLAYRLQLAGYPCIYVPQVIAYHDRTTRKEGTGLRGVWRGRKRGSGNSRALSFVHQCIIVQRYAGAHSWRVKFWTILREVLRVFFVVLYEPQSARTIAFLWRKRHALRLKKHFIQTHYDPAAYRRIEKTFMVRRNLFIP
ncbi:MAG: hypothetical protein COT39_02425 [Parcubacteria group bacterium CG08_land_8_20_14_0_20_48_21]|nr:MAG: hypothetical protein COT39_02425 [Parcubacteria group bacterium CG08_land_8_20_14_0_20_48_21]